MSDLLFKSIIVGNQLATNAQLAGQRAELNEINQRTAQQEARQQQQINLRDYIFSQRRALEHHYQLAGSNAAAVYRIAEATLQNLQAHQITSASLETMQDKEYLHQLERLAFDLRQQSAQHLTHEDIAALQTLIQHDRTIPVLHTYNVLRHIESIFPKDGALVGVLKWGRKNVIVFLVLATTGGGILSHFIGAETAWAITLGTIGLVAIYGHIQFFRRWFKRSHIQKIGAQANLTLPKDYSEEALAHDLAARAESLRSMGTEPTPDRHALEATERTLRDYVAQLRAHYQLSY
jgi:hypothetical protein